MLKIDSHQHFWKYDPVNYDWIDDDMAIIRRDFLPADLQPVLQANNIDGCITVQADQTEAENDFQLANASENNFIKGVVGWVDLQAENVEERLQHYSAFEKFKGLRHVLQGEPERDFMLRPAFLKGIGLLKKYGFTYDILIFPDQLAYFVIDHIAKPPIKTKEIDRWSNDIQVFTKFENVSCKVSGMVTEADYKAWKPADFYPYLDVVVETFGPNRLMFGSDWPVCRCAAEYEQMLGIVKDYFAPFSATEQQSIFGGNAVKFYNIKE
jgi:L-fuconolactonase